MISRVSGIGNLVWRCLKYSACVILQIGSLDAVASELIHDKVVKLEKL